MADTSELSMWLRRERQARNLSIRELSRQAKMSHTVLADAEKGLGMSVNACKRIADFFGVAQVQVLRMAGYVDKIEQPQNEVLGQIVKEGKELSESDKQEVLAFIRMKLAIRKRKK